MTKSKASNQRRRASLWQRGITTVETAIVGSLFFLVVFAIMDGGRMIYAYGAVAHAAREGVRFAVVRGSEASEDSRRTDAPATNDSIKAHILVKAAPLKDITVTTLWPRDDQGNLIKTAGNQVSVQVEYEFQSVLPFIPSANLVSRSTAVIHY